MAQDDEKLFFDSSSGKKESLKQLVEKYTTPLYHFIFQFVHDRQTAEDIVQDVWIKIWKHRTSFDQHKSLKTWIFTIAKNTTFDFLKKRKMIPFSFLQDEDESYIFETSDEKTIFPLEMLEQEELKKEMYAFIEHLPESYGAILFLAYRDDFSLKEIAEILDEPYNTIKSRHQRAIKKLKEAILLKMHPKGREDRIKSKV